MGQRVDALIASVAVTFALTCVVIAASTAPVAEAAECPNEAIREAQISAQLPEGTSYLPSCMALEMVSPPKKFVQRAFAPVFSLNGERVLFKSTAGLAETPGLQSYQGDIYVASRGGGTWTAAPTSPPASARISAGSGGAGIPYAFASDLGSWLVFGGTQAQSELGIAQFLQGGLDGSFSPLSPVLMPIDNTGGLPPLISTAEFTGSSADLSTTTFRPARLTITYLPGDQPLPDPNPGDDKNEYVVSDSSGDPSLELLTRDKAGRIYGGSCGAHVGGGAREVPHMPALLSGGLTQGAISADGSRIYFSTRPGQPEGALCSTTNPLRVLERIQTPSGPEISELAPGGPAEGDDLYQGASVDGGMAYFNSTRSLAPTDQDVAVPGAKCSGTLGASAGCDLYLYDASLPAGNRLVQVSAGEASDPTPGKGADVLSSVTAISTDGSHAYFVAEGVLTGENSEHASPVENEPNLYLYERDAAHPDGHTVFIGTLSAADAGELWGVESSFADAASAVPARGEDSAGRQVGGDGHILLFATDASLHGDDTDGGHRDVYRYDADSENLTCITCVPDAGPFDVEVNPYSGAEPLNFTEPGRWVSEDGDTVAFATSEPLSGGIADGKTHPYVWMDGELAILPGEVNPSNGKRDLPVVSAGGQEVGFSTEASLLPQDGDTASDVYVVRVDGGVPNPPPPQICEGEACQGPPSPSLTAPNSASESATSGNVSKGRPGPICPKGKVRKLGKCVKKKSHKKSVGHKSHKKRASHKHGGRK